jgi:hypothetical protein
MGEGYAASLGPRWRLAIPCLSGAVCLSIERQEAVMSITEANHSRRDRHALSRHSIGVALFLIAALASFGLSIGLWFSGHREEGVFVGLWVPSILAAGAFWIAANGPRS